MADREASRCPICGGPNDCRVAADSPGPCWCERETFPGNIPIPMKRDRPACICRDCLDRLRRRAGESATKPE